MISSEGELATMVAAMNDVFPSVSASLVLAEFNAGERSEELVVFDGTDLLRCQEISSVTYSFGPLDEDEDEVDDDEEDWDEDEDDEEDYEDDEDDEEDDEEDWDEDEDEEWDDEDLEDDEEDYEDEDEE
jgi:hypothetical protein